MGSEMCIRDRYWVDVRGSEWRNGAMAYLPRLEATEGHTTVSPRNKVTPQLKKPASMPAGAGEHFGWLGNILDQNLRCFVAFYRLSEITNFNTVLKGNNLNFVTSINI